MILATNFAPEFLFGATAGRGNGCLLSRISSFSSLGGMYGSSRKSTFCSTGPSICMTSGRCEPACAPAVFTGAAVAVDFGGLIRRAPVPGTTPAANNVRAKPHRRMLMAAKTRRLKKAEVEAVCFFFIEERLEALRWRKCQRLAAAHARRPRSE